jgi:hypothetical protein
VSRRTSIAPRPPSVHNVSANGADALHARISEVVKAAEPAPRAVVLDLETGNFVNAGSGDARRVIHDELAKRGIALAISRLNEEGRGRCAPMASTSA